MPAAPFSPPGCTVCGRCCFSELPEYVRVFGVDWDKMDDAARAHTEFIENRVYMKMRDGRCTALRIDPDASPPTFTCDIYAMRPDVCHSLERGTGNCRADYETKGNRTEAAVAAAKLVKLRRP